MTQGIRIWTVNHVVIAKQVDTVSAKDSPSHVDTQVDQTDGVKEPGEAI